MLKYRNRIVDSILQDKLDAKGAVLIKGPKWCGKTTTAIQKSASVLRMDNPDEKDQNLSLAALNPSRLLKGETPRLIDEWQIAPSLWDAMFSCKKSGQSGGYDGYCKRYNCERFD